MAPQKAPTESSGKSQEKSQVEELTRENKTLTQQNQSLAVESYMNSLADDKTFRLELLQTLTKISLSLENLNQSILEGLSQGLEEESPKDEIVEEVAKEESEEIIVETEQTQDKK